MGLLFPRAIGVVAFLLALIIPLQAQLIPQAKGVEGIWIGTLKAGAIELRLAFHVSSKDGKLQGTMDSLDQGAKDLKLTEVTFTDGAARFELKPAAIVFEGKINKEGTEIAGEFKQGGNNLPLTLKRVDKLPTAARPQEPKPPYPYRQEEVAYENKEAKIKLAGTLTLPKGDGEGDSSKQFPVAVLITGSGAQDRNEEIFGHKPFLLIADYLTRRGIAVLRVDDRGIGGTTGDFGKATTVDFAGDVQAGIDFLKARKDIDAKRIGLIGHSEGGIIAPMLAAQSKDVAFIVMLAGSGLPGDEILLLQNDHLLKAMGADKAEIDTQLKLLSLVFPVVREEKDNKVVEKRVREAVKQWKGKATEGEKKNLEELTDSKLQTVIDQLASPWFRFFLVHDPRPTLAKVQCPVLALNGEKDLQVPAKANLDEIAKALKSGGNKDFTTKEFPNLNHLFQTCKTGAVSEYGIIGETMAPVVLETMAEWILARVKKS